MHKILRKTVEHKIETFLACFSIENPNLLNEPSPGNSTP